MCNKFRWFAVVVFFLLGCFCYSSSPQAPAPVPPDVKLEPPDPALPAEIKALVGKWSGQWNSRWDALIYVEKVDNDSAQVIFSWGEYNTSRGACHCEPNWVRVQKATIKHSGGKATLEFYTPKLRPRWVRETHSATGSYDETFRQGGGSSGRYAYTFVLNSHEPSAMKGDFLSARESPLHIKLQKVE